MRRLRQTQALVRFRLTAYMTSLYACTCWCLSRSAGLPSCSENHSLSHLGPAAHRQLARRLHCPRRQDLLKWHCMRSYSISS